MGVGGCSDSLGAPSVKPLPEPDPYPPLIERGPLSPRIANYRIQVSLDPERHQLRATQHLTWVNTAQRSLSSLPFHLYMNAFKNQASAFMRKSHGQHRRAVASSDHWGWIDITSVTIDGRELLDTLRYPGEPDETVVELPLASPLEPGARIDIDFAFEVTLPEVFARTGYKGRFHMIGQWFPKIGVLVGDPGSEHFHCEPFHLQSEFFADFGTYDVDITVPDTHVVAATGVLTQTTDNGDGTRTLGYRARDVHDFAWMADPYMRVMSDQAQTDNGPVEVRVYYRPRQREFARRHLVAGKLAIELFSRFFRNYPWPLMSVIDPPLDASAGAGGMEYPTLVTTAGDMFLMRPGIRLPEMVTVHEVGHNWFQGMLASNEVDEAWLDEGVNDYADWVVMNENYGDGKNIIDWRGFTGDSVAVSAAVRLSDVPAPIDTRSYEFPDFSSYSAATYTKTAAALRSLEAVVGKDAFRSAMREYAQQYAFHHPTGQDLFRTLEQSLGRDLSWYLEPAFGQIGTAHLEVQKIACREQHEPRGVFGRGADRRTVTPKDAPNTGMWSCDVRLANLGRIPVPVDVDIVFADGTKKREHWQPEPDRAWHEFSLEYTHRVERVIIDPDHELPINDELGTSDIRETPSDAASRRAGARFGFWTQTAMQVFGL